LTTEHFRTFWITFLCKLCLNGPLDGDGIVEGRTGSTLKITQ